MTTTQITCPRCQHQYQRTYPKPIICPACGMYLHGCYDREDVLRCDAMWMPDGYFKHSIFRDGSMVVMARQAAVKNAFRDQECQINLPACGDCKWRKVP